MWKQENHVQEESRVEAKEKNKRKNSIKIEFKKLTKLIKKYILSTKPEKIVKKNYLSPKTTNLC